MEFQEFSLSLGVKRKIITEQEIKAFLEKKEVQEYLKTHMKVEISVESTDFCGYDITATACLDDKEIVSNDDFI